MTAQAHSSRLRLLAAGLVSLALLGSNGALASTYQLNFKIQGLEKKEPVSDQEPAPEADTDFTSMGTEAVPISSTTAASSMGAKGERPS